MNLVCYNSWSYKNCPTYCYCYVYCNKNTIYNPSFWSRFLFSLLCIINHQSILAIKYIIIPIKITSIVNITELYPVIISSLIFKYDAYIRFIAITIPRHIIPTICIILFHLFFPPRFCL